MLENLSPALIGLLGALVGGGIAIFSVRVTAKQNRVTFIHEKMTACILETLDLYQSVFTHATAVGLRIAYLAPEENGQKSESAYERYWRNLGNWASTSTKLYAKQLLFFPRALLRQAKILNRSFNKIRNIISNLEPEYTGESFIYPEDDYGLAEHLEKTKRQLDEFVNAGRAFVGSDMLKSFQTWEKDSFLAKEDAKDI